MFQEYIYLGQTNRALGHSCNEAKLILYDYDIGNGEEVSCYIEIVDYATSNWGLIGLDSVRIYQK